MEQPLDYPIVDDPVKLTRRMTDKNRSDEVVYGTLAIEPDIDGSIMITRRGTHKYISVTLSNSEMEKLVNCWCSS